MKNPKNPQYAVGMIVEHPKRPEWGPGKIVAVAADRIHVVFRDSLERKAKTLMRSMVELNTADLQEDALLDHLPSAHEEHGDWMLPANYDRLLKKAMTASASA